MAPVPAREDRRIILHFDYDCFYASVFEAEQPVLKSLPLAVQQKQIVVTCNYEARRRGLHKLQLIREAKQICPDVVIVLGEDLSKFRDASKELYLFLRGFVWGGRVEKLGFDELFLDVTDMITYNVDLLNPNDLEHSFFHLDRQEPTVGFRYNATLPLGPTYPSDPTWSSPVAQVDSSLLDTKLLVASHLAGHLRRQLEQRKGYTATVGVSTSKLLAKLVGCTHKPNSQTTLLPPYVAAQPGAHTNVLDFLDAHEIRKIPGIGSKIAQRIASHLVRAGVRSGTTRPETTPVADAPITVRHVRQCPGMGPLLLDKIVGGPGYPKDIGIKIWRLIHGVDYSEVRQARDLPTQISIEDTYGRMDTLDAVRRELVSLTVSLIRRMRTDLTERLDEREAAPGRVPGTLRPSETARMRWLARPKTVRLSTRLRPPPTPDGGQIRSFNRISRSAPLPQYVCNLDENIDSLAERLVYELVMSMFRKLHPEKSGWNLHLLNVAVTNMIETAGEHKQSGGRDIGKMFQTQDTADRGPSSVKEESLLPVKESVMTNASGESSPRPDPGIDAWESDEEEDMACVACTTCGALIPHFALVAHEVFHSAPGE
ncbi:putative DNA polymerase iota [Aspergillus steynii IBT 23096]|uniref:Putative DNA polymerase iota n=1 Tax=Aspergillus steynii IBT 23096 TaxID=1392250 RepID=A0A2I2GQ87_9EURO|nr:putative DNA polymerase iota [Aspergillus steynii IBT 23096]PLB55030.1 putative DNA polymerase iota [Aspergillus steynii IBT 23096]